MKHTIVSVAFASLALLPAIPSASAEENCTCRGPAREYEVGQSACLSTPKGYRMAKCGMVLNNTAWIFSDTPCVSSQLQMPRTRFQARSIAGLPSAPIDN